MSTDAQAGSAADILMGRAKASILALLFTHVDRSFYGREIARATGLAHGQVPRELARLVQCGLVTRSRRGREVYYQASRSSPVFDEIRGLVVKTRGVADVLREGLLAVAGGIDCAFVYGSFARGEEEASSDVDLMVVGEAGFGEVVIALGDARGRLGRELNPTVLSADEFRRRASGGDPFLAEVLRRPKLMLMGDEDALRGLGA
jgi:predicted nucleotidyltransferase